MPPIVYANSGKFLNDLGDYNNCNFNENEYTYITMLVLNKLVGYQYIGLCSPNQCRDIIVSNYYSKEIEDTFNEEYMSKTNTTFKPFAKLTFYDP